MLFMEALFQCSMCARLESIFLVSPRQIKIDDRGM